MTQLRRDKGATSNHFDAVLCGIGHRGSSFTDLDAMTHDEATDRYLVQEFKGPDEQLNRGQAKLLKSLARRDYCTVWCVRWRRDGDYDWCDVASRLSETISKAEYQSRFRSWWANTFSVDALAVPVHVGSSSFVPVDDISW